MVRCERSVHRDFEEAKKTLEALRIQYGTVLATKKAVEKKNQELRGEVVNLQEWLAELACQRAIEAKAAKERLQEAEKRAEAEKKAADDLKVALERVAALGQARREAVRDFKESKEGLSWCEDLGAEALYDAVKETMAWADSQVQGIVWKRFALYFPSDSDGEGEDSDGVSPREEQPIGEVLAPSQPLGVDPTPTIPPKEQADTNAPMEIPTPAADDVSGQASSPINVDGDSPLAS